MTDRLNDIITNAKSKYLAKRNEDEAFVRREKRKDSQCEEFWKSLLTALKDAQARFASEFGAGVIQVSSPQSHIIEVSAQFIKAMPTRHAKILYSEPSHSITWETGGNPGVKYNLTVYEDNSVRAKLQMLSEANVQHELSANDIADTVLESISQ